MNCLKALVLGVSVIALLGCATATVEAPDDASIEFARRARLIDSEDGARLMLPAGLLFDFGKSDLKPGAQKGLDVCYFIIQRARGTIVVEGHTDSIGSLSANQKLSVDRAEAVRQELILRKIAPSRIEIRGYADRKPAIQNAKTDEDIAANRRAEVLFKGETVDSLNAPKGCEKPVETKPASGTFLDKMGQGLKGMVEKASSP